MSVMIPDDGEFPVDAQKNFILQMLSSFTDMFLCGPSAKRNSNFDHDGRTLCGFIHCTAVDVHCHKKETIQTSY